MYSKEIKQAKPEGEKGQALLEFALVAVFLVLVLFGIIDFARLFFAYATMSQGAREGARFGITHPGQDEAIEERARAMLVLIGGEADVEITYPGIDPDPGDRCTTNPQNMLCPIRVRVTADLEVWTPIIPNVTVVAQSTMHIE